LKIFGLMIVLLLVILLPASENNRTEGTDVAGIIKNLRANSERIGNCLLWSRHQSNNNL